MKKNKFNICEIACVLALFALLFVSCSNNEDSRSYEAVKIVGVKVNNELFTPEYSDKTTTIVIPSGRDLSKVKLQLLVANGELVNFSNEKECDCRKPLNISLKGYDGTQVETKLRVQSPPKLTTFVVAGLNVPQEDIHVSSSSIIVQVPKKTDLTALKVTMEFTNGTLTDFENGKALDYTKSYSIHVKGVDEETIYPYEFVITTEPVGPAFVKAMVINGLETDSIVVKDKNVIVPYIPSLIDFTSSDISLKLGFGNKVDPAFSGKGMNLLTGTNKVKVTGTNGVVTEFTIGVPQLSLKPVFEKSYASLKSLLGIADNDLSAVGFSGSNILVANYTVGTKCPAYFDLTGNKIGYLDADGVNVTGYGFRKFATDVKGAVLACSLGMSSGEQWIYKWNNLNSKGEPYISFSKSSLGVTYNPRAAGINVSGSLDGDAVIVLTIAQNTDVFVWKVKGGVLDPKPLKYSFPYDKTSYYWSIEPMPFGTDGFVGFATTANTIFGNGIMAMNSTMGELQKLSGIVITDGRIMKYKNRIYLAYTAQLNTNKAEMCICDITDGQLSSYQKPIFDKIMLENGANGNATVDADFSVINGKLYAVFTSSNVGLYLYCLEK